MGAARAVLGSAEVDVVLVPKAGRRKKLLIADMDSTMIEQECIDELADALGLKAKVSDITARAMNGELDFEQALETRVALLAGLERDRISEIRRERITYAPGGRALVQTMKAHGAYTALISGGFTFFADHIGKRIGFDEVIANELEFDGDRLTGTVGKPIVDKSTKARRLAELVAEREIRRQRQPWRSAMAPTICPCSRVPASAWRCTPSPRSPPKRRSASIMAT